MELRQDMHIHTFRSACCRDENTPDAVAQALDERGILLAGLTDHIDAPADQETFAANVAATRQAVRGLACHCRILVGAEVSMLTPESCAIDTTLAARLDFVMVSCNHFHIPWVQPPPEPTPAALARQHLDFIAGACDLGFATTVAHPFFNEYSPRELALQAMRAYPRKRLMDVLGKAARAGLAFEVNPYRIVPVLGWFHELVPEARRRGVHFTLGSDSHALDTIGFPERPVAAGLAEHASAPQPAPWKRIQAREICDRIGLTPADLTWPFAGAQAV